MKILIKSHLLLVKDIIAVDLKKINLDNDNNFEKDDPDDIIHVRLLAWRNKFENCKTLKKIREELMPAAWHLKRWWNLYIIEDEKCFF